MVVVIIVGMTGCWAAACSVVSLIASGHFELCFFMMSKGEIKCKTRR